MRARLVSPDEKVILTLDGQVGLPLEYMDEVVMKKSAFSVTPDKIGDEEAISKCCGTS